VTLASPIRGPSARRRGVLGGQLRGRRRRSRGVPAASLAAQRFGLTAFPAIFAGQFGLLSVAMSTGLPAGLASVVAPLQPVFTIPLAVVVLGERPTVRQVALVCLAIAGLGTIAPGAPTAFLFRQSHSVSRRRHVAAGMS
jgi:drug/metabolite transporter (DMT)-like permease